MKIDINFGDSYIQSLYYKIHTWFLHQWMGPVKYFLANSLFLLGPSMLNMHMEHLTELYIGNQITEFPIHVPELNKTANLQVNWRLTSDPVISAMGQMDVAFWADIGPAGQYCTIPQINTVYNFMDTADDYFQFVITDRLVNCFMQALERQNFFHYTLSS
jgi:hypothetical protein